MGRGLNVAVTATAFRFTARSKGAYGIQVPEGVSGTLYGHVAGDDDAAGDDSERAASR